MPPPPPALNLLQDEFNSLHYRTFGVLALPQLTIHSRDPESLFVPNLPLLNRKGHTYAAKWLWNRLIYGPNYNVSDAVFSEDAYFCPPVVTHSLSPSLFAFSRDAPTSGQSKIGRAARSSPSPTTSVST